MSQLPPALSKLDQSNKPGEAAAASNGGNWKETIESILVAFILAFIFRAFVVEAFVIPTGSMAPTLLGAHMNFRCEDCGYEFDVNYNAESNGTDMAIRSNAGQQPYSIFCPNCGLKVSNTQIDLNSPANYGDRILVLKYLYLFGNDPKRWDVVVFKSPTEPHKYHYTQNYIKRLVGRPGESVVILDGDVYISRNNQPFEIQTKPHKVQEALWRIIYNNDFHPQNNRRGTERWQQPWQEKAGGAGWNLQAQNGRVFTFDNPQGESTLFFNPDANHSAHSFTDYLAYNASSNYTPSTGHENTASDLKLNFFYQRKAGDGPLQARLSKLGHVFTATLAPDRISLWHQTGDGQPVLIGEKPGEFSTADSPLHVEFMNVDYQVTLRIDGHDIIQTTPADYQPDFQALLKDFQSRKRQPPPQVEIVGDRQTCTISHLSLWRDNYYTNTYINRAYQWASPEDFPEHVIHLGEDEYFVLGDNSLNSADARGWTDEIDLPHEDLKAESGRVPGRFLLGKAFFVYWPAGFRPFGSPYLPGIVPNFGEMRFIH